MADLPVIEPIKLTPEQVKTLQDMGPHLAALTEEMKRAERAGIDVAEQKEKLSQTIKLRDGLLKEYAK